MKKLERDSAIAAHAIFEGHAIDFDNPKILRQGFRNHKERRFAEAILIDAEPSCVNRSDGIDLPPIWRDSFSCSVQACTQPF